MCGVCVVFVLCLCDACVVLRDAAWCLCDSSPQRM